MKSSNRLAIRQTAGFSLVIALGLMAFILTILLGFTALVQVETRSSTIALQQLESRQNALLGIQIALGELQAAAGPDQRSVARADLMSQHPSVGTAPTNTPKDTRKYWVGISHSDGSSNIEPTNQPVRWLVSGIDTSNATPADQLIQPFNDSVVLVDTNSVEINNELSAGKVMIEGNPAEAGAFAWIVDDETQKAKLAPANDEVNNENPSTLLSNQRHVLPGYFDLFGTTGLSTSLASLARTDSLNDLAIDDANNALLASEHYYDYTLAGYGILSNTREGGLKKDLTAAYERDSIFNNLFPNKSAPYNSTADNSYIAIDPQKFRDSDASELRANGYIHHGIFRDYYTLKDRVIGNQLPINVFDKQLIDNNSNDATRLGNVGPHEFSSLNHPYGNFDMWTGSGSPDTDGAHNPISPVLAFMQQNAWFESTGANVTAGGEQYPEFQSHLQLWTGLYNPYNISLQLAGDANKGPMFRGYPEARIYLLDNVTGDLLSNDAQSGGPTTRFDGFMVRGVRWMYAEEAIVIEPGKTQVFGFGDDVPVSQTEGARDNTFSSNLQTAAQNSAFRNQIINIPASDGIPPLDMVVEMPFLPGQWTDPNWNGPNVAWGLPSNQDSTDPETDGGHEIAQIFYVPFSVDNISDGPDIIEGKSIDKRFRVSVPRFKLLNNSPGIQFLRENATFAPSRMNPSEEATYRFELRKTIESDVQRIRPLIDSNIRAIWNNPKWDSIANLNTLATYKITHNKPANTLLDPTPPYTSEGTAGFLPYGNATDDGAGPKQVILFDIPREPLVSVGQLQHAAAGRFSYEPSYIVGNSYANIRIPLGNWVQTNGNDLYSDNFAGNFSDDVDIDNPFSLYDASYLVNEALFDAYIFTTIPQDRGSYTGFLDQTELLPNPRYLAYEPYNLSFAESNIKASTAGRTNAGFLLVDGAFNVNSTSVEAWEVFLSGTKGLPYLKLNADGSASTTYDSVDGVRFPRVQTVLGVPWENTPADEDAAWFGFRSLTTQEIRDLAVEIVRLVQAQGPFHNLSEFVNRQLLNDDSGKSGVLQAALDNVINSTLPPSMESDLDTSLYTQLSPGSTQGAGFPTQLLQGDVLQALAPYMQTRSDTFKIRSYGETLDPINGEVISKVWCEAVVQRLPDPVADTLSGTTTADRLKDLESSPSSFGRQFRIVSFRWLDEDEV